MPPLPMPTKRAAARGPDAPVASVPGVSVVHLPRLARLGIHRVRDLLYHLPRRYEDTRTVTAVRDLVAGSTQTIQARVVKVNTRKSAKKHMVLVEATLDDNGARVEAIWFNQRFLTHSLVPGADLLLSGPVTFSKTGLTLRNPKFERVSEMQQHVGTLAAVYPETDKLSSRQLRRFIEMVLPAAAELEDILPSSIRAAEGLPDIATALRAVHNPETLEAAAVGRGRIAFEEVFQLQLASQRAHQKRLQGEGAVVPYNAAVARSFTADLPFTLTQGQRIAGHQILTDMAGPGAMNRLLQGDVGSGKTAVAALAIVMADRAGFQSALMAPTEILARQHHATLERLLSGHGILPRLMVGSTPARARREITESLTAGLDTLVVGTHALIEDDINFARLGLIIVDEQHRFGVAQRQRLRLKSELTPNFLAMTATPIPRSLALTLYGDVNVSEIRELPPGRTPVETRVVAASGRDAAYQFVRQQVAEGRQVFVICPLVEESDKLGVKSATAEHQRLSTTVFPELSVDILHGRMAAREKDECMSRFAAGEIDILVATSVVEVGVDVPNASVMIIEAAERFGLAQLHQFRGRVGRGGHASYCLLFADGDEADAARRLESVARTASGFDIAELDLRIRGGGDFGGVRQHGLPMMRAADLLDVGLAERARAAAAAWLDRDPDLTAHPPLSRAMHDYHAVFDLD